MYPFLKQGVRGRETEMRKRDRGRDRKGEAKREIEVEVYFWDSSAEGMKIVI